MKIKLFCCVLLILGFSFNAFGSNNQKIQDLLKTYSEKGEFSGSVLVAKGDKILFKGAVGLANRAWSVPNRTTTRFRINSITKQFTSMLIMQLVEEGRIDLNEEVGTYLDNLPNTSAEKIKIRHLLQSASGLPNLDTPSLYKNDLDKRLTDFGYVIKTFLGGDLNFDPGSKFNYNNGDFIVLGAIIEKVSGKTFETVLNEKILGPLGMNNTGLIKNGEIIKNLAGGYVYRAGKYYNEPFYSIENYSSAGAMYSTLDDMFLWDRAIIENKLLSKTNTDVMFTPSAKLGFVAFGSWVYNLKLSDGKSYKLIERQGAIGGFSSLNIISPDEELSFIFLGNVETGTLFRTYSKQGLSFEILKTVSERNKITDVEENNNY